MKTLALGIVVTGVLTTSALAQTVNGPFDTAAIRRAAAGAFPVARAEAAAQTPPTEPESSPFTVLAGVDVPSVYLFRGIRQEFDPAFTAQPYVDVGVAASDRVNINVGLWNSMHTGSSGTGCNCDASVWYELDFYASATVTAGKVKPGVLFTSYTSPNDFFPTVHEVAFVATFDDSEMALPLSPKVVLAAEIGGDGSADLGSNPHAHKGTYLEVGVRPAFKLGTSPATLSVPAKIGMSLNNYFETVDVNDVVTDSKFGYFQIGAAVSVPVGGGPWEVHGGVDLYRFGNNILRIYNHGDQMQAVGSVGVSGTF